MKLCILGMHRSGTSMITRLLHECGLYLGPEEWMMPANDENPAGFWENRFIAHLNDQILAARGGSWDNPPPHTPGWSQNPQYSLFAQRFKGILTRYDSHVNWGWKDPRNALTLELWLNTFPDLKLLLCLRNPLEVAHSLGTDRPMRRMSWQDALSLWVHYHESILLSTDVSRLVITHYETYFYDGAAELRRVTDALEMEVSETQIQQAVATIHTDLRNHDFPTQILSHPRVPESVWQYYNMFTAHAGDVYQQMQNDPRHQLSQTNAYLKRLFEITGVAALTLKPITHEQIAQLQANHEQELVTLKRDVEREHAAQLQAVQQRLEQQRFQDVQVLRQQVTAVSHELYEKRLQQESIYQTRSWKLLQALWRFKNWLLPIYTRRWRAYELLLTTLSTLFTQGPVALASRVHKWLRGERRYYNANVPMPIPESPVLPLPPIVLPIVSYAPPPSSVIRVLYVRPAHELSSTRYRVDTIAHERLPAMDIETIVIVEDALSDWQVRLTEFQVVVLFRVAMSPTIRAFVTAARQHQVAVVFDIDDYIFDPTTIHLVDAIKDFKPDDLARYVEGVQRYQQALLACDYFIGSTEFLQSRAAELGRKAYIMRNGLNKRQLELAEYAVLKRKGSSDDVIRIGYFSGTNTHRKDFQSAVPALLRILNDFPQVKLVVRGYLKLPTDFKPYEHQTEHLPFIPWEELVEAMAHVDIAIAPLEMNNPYTEAKSELKYFEAALVGVPVVASPTEPFLHAIAHGINGFLANSDEEWYRYLSALICHPEKRVMIGQNAYRDMLHRYTPSAQANVSQQVIRSIALDKRMPHHALHVCWITTRPAVGSGGHRMIFRIAECLRQQGHRVSIYFLDDGAYRTSDEIRDFVETHYMVSGIEYFWGTDSLSVCDALIATAWNTVEIVARYAFLARQTYYFVQDYAPMFFETEEEKSLVRRSYEMGLKPIAIGSWMTQHIREQFGGDVSGFEFPIDHRVYHPPQDKHINTRPKVLFFARTTMARRRYELGIEALKLLHDLCPRAEIILFGSLNIDRESIPFPHINMGVIDDLATLALLYQQIDVALVFSTTNPSVLPLELMACGCAVVELDNAINRAHFGDCEQVTLVSEKPQAIADVLHGLLADEDLRQQKINNGILFARTLPTIAEVADQFVFHLRRQLP